MNLPCRPLLFQYKVWLVNAFVIHENKGMVSMYNPYYKHNIAQFHVKLATYRCVILLFYRSGRANCKTCVYLHNTCGQARVHVPVKTIHTQHLCSSLSQAWTPQTYTHTPCITQKGVKAMYIYTRGQHSKKRFSHFCNHAG